MKLSLNQMFTSCVSEDAKKKKRESWRLELQREALSDPPPSLSLPPFSPSLSPSPLSPSFSLSLSPLVLSPSLPSSLPLSPLFPLSSPPSLSLSPSPHLPPPLALSPSLPPSLSLVWLGWCHCLEKLDHCTFLQQAAQKARSGCPEPCPGGPCKLASLCSPGLARRRRRCGARAFAAACPHFVRDPRGFSIFLKASLI